MKNELKTGLTILLAIIAAYLGFRFLSDVPLFSAPMEVVTTFDRVDGLGSGSQVQLHGVKVGSVKRISLTPANRVEVVMSIEMDLRIPNDSRAQLTSQGILDAKTILIEPGRSERMLESGDEIEGVYMDSIMEVLGERGEELGDDISRSFDELNRFLLQLNRALDEESSRSIHETIRHLEVTASAMANVIESRKVELEESISSLHHMMAQLDTTVTGSRPHVEQLLENLEVSSEEVRRMSGELDTTMKHLNGILEKIDHGEGSIGRMVNDPSLYENVDSLSVELKNLIREVQENPGRYLRHMRLIEIF